MLLKNKPLRLNFQSRCIVIHICRASKRAVRAAIESIGASSCSSGGTGPTQPIEQTSFKLQAPPRKATNEPSVARGPWNALGRILHFCPPPGCTHYFAARGCDAD